MILRSGVCVDMKSVVCGDIEVEDLVILMLRVCDLIEVGGLRSY